MLYFCYRYNRPMSESTEDIVLVNLRFFHFILRESIDNYFHECRQPQNKYYLLMITSEIKKVTLT